MIGQPLIIELNNVVLDKKIFSVHFENQFLAPCGLGKELFEQFLEKAI